MGREGICESTSPPRTAVSKGGSILHPRRRLLISLGREIGPGWKISSDPALGAMIRRMARGSAWTGRSCQGLDNLLVGSVGATRKAFPPRSSATTEGSPLSTSSSTASGGSPHDETGDDRQVVVSQHNPPSGCKDLTVLYACSMLVQHLLALKSLVLGDVRIQGLASTLWLEGSMSRLRVQFRVHLLFH